MLSVNGNKTHSGTKLSEQFGRKQHTLKQNLNNQYKLEQIWENTSETVYRMYP